MAAALAKIFGSGKKGEPPSPQQAIQKLRETEEMLSKKTEFLEKKIDKEMQTVKKNGMKNKRGVCHLGGPYILIFTQSFSWTLLGKPIVYCIDRNDISLF